MPTSLRATALVHLSSPHPVGDVAAPVALCRSAVHGPVRLRAQGLISDGDAIGCALAGSPSSRIIVCKIFLNSLVNGHVQTRTQTLGFGLQNLAEFASGGTAINGLLRHSELCVVCELALLRQSRRLFGLKDRRLLGGRINTFASSVLRLLLQLHVEHTTKLAVLCHHYFHCFWLQLGGLGNLCECSTGSQTSGASCFLHGLHDWSHFGKMHDGVNGMCQLELGPK